MWARARDLYVAQQVWGTWETFVEVGVNHKMLGDANCSVHSKCGGGWHVGF